MSSKEPIFHVMFHLCKRERLTSRAVVIKTRGIFFAWKNYHNSVHAVTDYVFEYKLSHVCRYGNGQNNEGIFLSRLLLQSFVTDFLEV